MYKVILVDDEAIALEGLQNLTLWRNLGFEISGVCEDGEEALSRIQSCPPDLVITDIRMPGMGGLELMESVRKGGRHDPVFVVLSGYNKFEYAKEALRYGVRFYLLKPVDEQELENALRVIKSELDARARENLQQEPLQEPSHRQQPVGRGRGPSTEEDLGVEGRYELPAAYEIEELLHAVERLQEDEVALRLQKLFETFQHNRTAPEIVYMTSSQIVLNNMELLKDFGGSHHLWRSMIDFFNNEPRSLAELELSLYSFLSLCMVHIKQYKDRNSEQLLVQVERYLQLNFNKNLTVKMVAEHFYVHAGYLGQAFIKKNGIRILEYIHDLRIAEAKKRLVESNETVRAIAEDVGYMHYHHFLKEFQKREELKPVAYRNRHRSEDAGTGL